MMDNVVDEFLRISRRCERAAKKLEADSVRALLRQLHSAIGDVHESSANMFLGHHAFVYIEGFRPKEQFDYYSNYEHHGRWVVCSPEDVQAEILRRAGTASVDVITDAAKVARDTFDEGKSAVLPVLDAIAIDRDDSVIRDLRAKINAIPSHKPAKKIAESYIPPEQHVTWDDIRVGSNRPSIPPHLQFKANLIAMQSCGTQATEFAKQVRYAIKYLETRHQLKGNTVAKNDGKVFVGHGRSKLWSDLKDLLQDRLELSWDEFNREPTAGLSTKERLEAMVDAASFAFLVMTAEDEHADGSKHARENVIHEAGLFQGRLGFSRAIILLEEGCTEFSNIVGLSQIRFPKGNILAVSEEIRRVLEREGIINK